MRGCIFFVKPLPRPASKKNQWETWCIRAWTCSATDWRWDATAACEKHLGRLRQLDAEAAAAAPAPGKLF